MALNPINLITSILGVPTTTYNGQIMTQYDASMLFNKQEAEKQRMWQEKMWNMQNEYNSPAAQMQRAREAGLNPGLLYGQPISEAPLASGGAEASAPSPQGIDNGLFRTALQSVSNLAILPEQKDLLRAQAEDAKSRIPLNRQRVLESESRIDQIRIDVSLKTQQILESQSRVELNDLLGKESAQRVINLQTENKQSIDSFAARLESIQADAYSSWTQGDKNSEDAKLLRKRVASYNKELQAWLDHNLAEIDLMRSQEGVNKSTKENLDEQYGVLVQTKNKLELANNVYSETGRLQSYVGIVSDAFGAVGNLFGGIGSLARGLKAGKHQNVRHVDYDDKGKVIGGYRLNYYDND